MNKIIINYMIFDLVSEGHEYKIGGICPSKNILQQL
jgi:hypothetical protein